MSINLDLPDKVSTFHQNLLVIDGHCDVISKIVEGRGSLLNGFEEQHVDLNKLKAGNVGVQVFALFIESCHKPYNALGRALHLLDCFYNEIELCKSQVSMGLSVKTMRKDIDSGKIVAVLGIEGGEALNGDISVLRVFYRLGVRLIGLTWNQRNQIADGAFEGRTAGGLTNFGVEVIKEMNRLGMIIDLSHISESGFWDVLKISSSPVYVSHANCKKLCAHPRNLTDEQIKALAGEGGVIGLSFNPDFLVAKGEASIDDLIDHIDHVASLVGTKSIGLGSDFDGIDSVPAGLEDCSCFPLITYRLMDRGYTKSEIADIMGNNVFNLMRKILK